jgi:hypothetical protein
MTRPVEPASNAHGTGLRLNSGLEVLDRWADTACQVDLDAISDALFAILDRSVYCRYGVINDPIMARDFVVMIHENLALRAQLHDVDTFGIVFIGSPADTLAAVR